MMNIPVVPLVKVWFSDENMLIVPHVCTIFEETVRFLMPPGKDAPDHEIILNGQSIDHSLAPIMILMKNWALADYKVREILRAKFMPLDLYYKIINPSDRSKPLEQGSKITNYLIRFMISLTCTQIRDTCSEFMFAMCNQNGNNK